uniref:Neural-cadherin n=1 Tax=Timema genevievae TaxID=629358 RepID=A0A7R9PMR2_TIMGE|nr:unnamed protein product [Timema genevievae]
MAYCMRQRLCAYEVEKKLYLGVREQKRLNTTGVVRQTIGGCAHQPHPPPRNYWLATVLTTLHCNIGVALNFSMLYLKEFQENVCCQSKCQFERKKMFLYVVTESFIRYKITGGNLEDVFAVKETTGAIFVSGPLDYETRKKYELKLTASNKLKESSTTVVIHVKDLNDNPPLFERPTYRTQITEEDDRNLPKRVLQVTANDADKDRPLDIMYFLTGQGIDSDNPANSKFDINRTSGDIFVLKPLDRDLPNGHSQYKFTVFAQDEGGEGLVGYADVQVNLKDINDNAPGFPHGTYFGNVTENGTAGMTVMTMTAIDHDDPSEGTNARIIYSIEKNVIEEDTGSPIFEIESDTGVIKTTVCCLDRERTPDYSIQVVAMDGGGLKDRERTPDYSIQVVAMDGGGLKEREHRTIPYKWSLWTEEDSKVRYDVIKTTVCCLDRERTPDYSIQVVAMDGGGLKEREHRTIPYKWSLWTEEDSKVRYDVIKTTVCCLDRERTPDYSIQVVAMDGGGLKDLVTNIFRSCQIYIIFPGTGTVSIRILDINDMPPKFTKEEWFTEVDETDGITLPETPILTVTVHDEDEINKFQYKIVDNSGYGADKFKISRNIDGTGALMIAQHLDFEDRMQSNGFRFRIRVSDLEEDGDQDNYHVAYSWVVVKLRDVNDNRPQFERPNMEVSVDEDLEVGESLARFKATDPDQGGRGVVKYSIVRTSDRRRQFCIDHEGTVAVQRSLDRENTPKHEVKILAVDEDVPPKTATATLTVIVQDINDNAPKFLEDYRPVLLEHVPPRKIVEIMATDEDEMSKNNGPPFTFKMDSKADDIIRASFKVEHNKKGANRVGSAVVSSLRSFDREQQKLYPIPIVIKDSGKPARSSTNTLTVIIGDVNDNRMQPGFKDILVYGYTNQAPDSEIGRVFVNDPDDWDLPDKKFYWEGAEHPRFRLDEDTGMITMRHGTKEGRYHLRFKVDDRKQSQTDVPANVTVTVRGLPHEAIINSGSICVAGLTDEDLVRVVDHKSSSQRVSKINRLRGKLADILNTERENVEVFSVQQRQKHPPVTDVRFTVHRSRYYKPVRLNGLVLMHREEIEKDVGINITMVAIDECLYENHNCEGSCTNTMNISNSPYLVDGNTTSLVGVRVDVMAECTCGARNFTESESCRTSPCYNGGRCSEGRYGSSCSCPSGSDGPRCQQTTRSFRGNGWAWYPPLAMCDNSHLSLEFITRKEDGLLLYNGPIVSPETEELLVSDFISVELEKGSLRLLLDFGSGTVELKVKTKGSLSDGEWHRIDVLWDTQNVRLVVDLCKSADVEEPEDGSPLKFDDTSCQAHGTVPPFNEYLNVNTPLQIGGLHLEQFDPNMYHWQFMPVGKGFDGCIKNVFHNSKLYDLGAPGLSRASVAGCPQTEQVCNTHESTFRCWEHGTCVGSFSEPRCECNPGWTGPSCLSQTVPTTFNTQSYVKYALSFEPDHFSTQLQLRFRTREKDGELFRVSDQHNREYGILEITYSHLHFRYNLDSSQPEEKDIWISDVTVSRSGSTVILQLDGGEGRRYNETFLFEGHQWLVVDKQEGVFAGGKAEYTGVRTFEVHADYQKGCLDNIRLDGKHLPLPPAMNGTQWGQATMARNLQRNCPSNKPCMNVVCPEPFECVDTWNKFECTCGEGQSVSADGKGCTDKNECLEELCLNGGTCINQDPRHRYRCICPGGFWGDNCELVQEGQTLKLGVGALAAILTCLLTILILLLLSVACNRRRETHTKHPPPNDDIRENIINYADEGGGEDDMTAFDIKPLQIPVEGNSQDLSPKIQCKLNCLNELYRLVVLNCARTLILISMFNTWISYNLFKPPCHPSVGIWYRKKSIDIVLIKSIKREVSVPYQYRNKSINYIMENVSSETKRSFLLIPSLYKCVSKSINISNPGPVVEEFMEKYKRADSDINVPPFDDLRNYAYEGPGSVAGSLSSLPSGTDDNDHTFDYLEGWGPRFHKLDNIYRQDSEESGEDNSGRR